LGGIIYSLIKLGHFSFHLVAGFFVFIRPYLHLHLFIAINAIIFLVYYQYLPCNSLIAIYLLSIYASSLRNFVYYD